MNKSCQILDWGVPLYQVEAIVSARRSSPCDDLGLSKNLGRSGSGGKERLRTKTQDISHGDRMAPMASLLELVRDHLELVEERNRERMPKLIRT